MADLEHTDPAADGTAETDVPKVPAQPLEGRRTGLARERQRERRRLRTRTS